MPTVRNAEMALAMPREGDDVEDVSGCSLELLAGRLGTSVAIEVQLPGDRVF